MAYTALAQRHAVRKTTRLIVTLYRTFKLTVHDMQEINNITQLHKLWPPQNSCRS